MQLFTRLFLSANAFLAAFLSAANAQVPEPKPPCEESSFPAYGPVGSNGSQAVWKSKELTNWRPAACLGWSGPSLSVVALAVEFHFSGSLDALLARLGALDSYPSIRYWSTSRKQWRALVTRASVVAGADGPDTKTALDPDDFVVGKDNFYAEISEESGRTAYRLHVLARRGDHVALASENVTPINALGLTIFSPFALQSVIFLDRRGPDLWGFYSILRTASGTSRIASGHEASYLNRQVALFRYLAGIPTNLEPPIAR
jgi:hypothetical protein